MLLATGVGSLQVVLEKGETEDWFATPYISVLTLTTILSAIAFIWRELSTDKRRANVSGRVADGLSDIEAGPALALRTSDSGQSFLSSGHFNIAPASALGASSQ